MSSQALADQQGTAEDEWKGSAGRIVDAPWSQGLKLMARDAEDYLVVSAHLQDAIIAVSEMTYMARSQRFALVANRFKWESAPAAEALGLAAGEEIREGDPDEAPAGPVYERTHCGVLFEGVTGVKCRGIDRSQSDTFLDLLAIEAAPGAVHLRFGGGACLRLEGGEVSCRVQDLGEPWPTTRCPCHPDLMDGEGRGRSSRNSGPKAG